MCKKTALLGLGKSMRRTAHATGISLRDFLTLAGFAPESDSTLNLSLSCSGPFKELLDNQSLGKNPASLLGRSWVLNFFQWIQILTCTGNPLSLNIIYQTL